MHPSLWALVAAAQAGEKDVLSASVTAPAPTRFPLLMYPHDTNYIKHQHTREQCNVHMGKHVHQLKAALVADADA